ncbi:MAG: hypothetical protein P8Y29_01715 [Gemmatimonadota bacterium]|jgi:hypothetical protein
MSSRFIAGLTTAILLTQLLAPAAAVAIETRHDDKPAAHGSHHPGCPFDGKENCPHHKAAAGEPSLVRCGAGDALAGGPTGATLRLIASEPVQLLPVSGITAAPAAAIRSNLAWHTVIPDIPPPRVPDSL